MLARGRPRAGHEPVQRHGPGLTARAERGRIGPRSAGPGSLWASRDDGLNQTTTKGIRVKRYEGLFILNTTAKEDGIKETIDKISVEIANAGGKVETVQKMDKRSFSRVSDKKYNSGFYVNVIFEGQPTTLTTLHHRFALGGDVFRVMFTTAQPPQPAQRTIAPSLTLFSPASTKSFSRSTSPTITSFATPP